MATWHRTPLAKKYRIIKLLSISQRTWGDKYIPQFKKTAKELKMKFKIIVLITFVISIVFGQKITDTTNVVSGTNDKFEQSLNAVKSDTNKLNKTGR